MTKHKRDYRVISDCIHCSHCFRRRYVADNCETCLICDFNQKEINQMFGFPSWCPLEDDKND